MTTMTLERRDLADPGNFVAAVPHQMFDVLRREAPVWFHPSTADTEGFWCIAKYADLVELSRDYPTCRPSGWDHAQRHDERGHSSTQRLMMLMMDPPQAHEAAAARQQGLHPAHDRPARRAHPRDHEGDLDEVAERGECDFVVDVAAELPLQVIAEMMGVPQADRHKIFEWSNRHDRFGGPGVQRHAEEARSAPPPRCSCTRTSSPSRSAREPGRRHHQHPAAGRGRRRAARPTSSSTCSSCCSRWPATRRPAT